MLEEGANRNGVLITYKKSAHLPLKESVHLSINAAKDRPYKPEFNSAIPHSGENPQFANNQLPAPQGHKRNQRNV